jgi:demethylmenaquinone methyltransferase/2-methoxy-6-polyprenyl-1,4-benzoquinol methylase
MQDKAAYIKSMFSAIAGKYDLLNRLLSLRRDMGWRRFAISKCDIEPGSLALDVATGTGDMARLLIERDSGCTFVGIDFCPEMLNLARAKLQAAIGSDTVHLILGDALSLPFPDDTFDCATIGFALRNVVSIADAFREMARVVKPGGRIVSLELTQPSSRPFRTFHDIYLWRFVQFVGTLVSGNREAYRYLPQSIAELISPQEIKQQMERAGLKQVEFHRLTFGVATVHAGIKTKHDGQG